LIVFKGVMFQGRCDVSRSLLSIDFKTTSVINIDIKHRDN